MTKSHNSKATWKLINELLCNNNPNSSTSPTLIKDNVTYAAPYAVVSIFNDYFSTIGSVLSQQIPPSSPSYKYYLTHPNTNSFSFFPTTSSEIYNFLSELDNSSTQGHDSLSASVIKPIAHIIASPLSVIINHSFSNALFPDTLKIAKVIPLYKSGSKSDPSNYRPISLLNTFSKIYEKAINARIISFLSRHKIVYKNQFGFRKNHSTELALIKLLDDITSAIDSKHIVCSIAIDLKKAFDTVDLDKLLYKLDYYGFRGLANQYFKSYLLFRQQYVHILVIIHHSIK
jgi:hypothetical protein